MRMTFLLVFRLGLCIALPTVLFSWAFSSWWPAWIWLTLVFGVAVLYKVAPDHLLSKLIRGTMLMQVSNAWEEVAEEQLVGHTCLVTGGNRGLGNGIAVLLARKGIHVILALRGSNKQAVVDDICRKATALASKKKGKRPFQPRVSAVHLELLDLKTVTRCIDGIMDVLSKSAAAEHKKELVLDYIVLNAAVLPLHAKATVQRLETQFQVNFLAQFALIRGLLCGPRPLVRTRRVVAVVSELHRNAAEKSATALTAAAFRNAYGVTGTLDVYASTKWCLVATMNELARRVASVHTQCACICPGPVHSALSRSAPMVLRWLLEPVFLLFFRQPLAAAQPVCSLLFDEVDVKPSGGAACRYFHMNQQKPCDSAAADVNEGNRVWSAAEELLARVL